MERSKRNATVTKVTPKWVRENGTLVPFDVLKLSPFDALKTSGSGVKEVYDTPLGRFRIDAAGRVAFMDSK